MFASVRAILLKIPHLNVLLKYSHGRVRYLDTFFSQYSNELKGNVTECTKSAKEEEFCEYSCDAVYSKLKWNFMHIVEY